MEEYEQEASKRLKEDPLVVTLELGCNQAQQLCVRRLVGQAPDRDGADSTIGYLYPTGCDLRDAAR